MLRILLTGSSGMVGRAVAKYFAQKGHIVTPLVSSRSRDGIYWNPTTEEVHLDEWENFDAVIHLAGDNITSGYWTKAKKESILASRVRDTKLLVKTLAQLQNPPKVLFCASAVGFYGDRGEEILTEDSAKGSGFLSDVCVQWEKAALIPGIRVVTGRFGTVLSSTGGILRKVLPLFSWGLGGRLGKGQQWMSWIALKDLVRAVEFVLEKSELKGVFNFTSPNPVRNTTWTQVFSKKLHRSARFSIPSWVLRLVLGEMADELLLVSTRAIPKRLKENGFVFSCPDLEQCNTGDFD